MPTIPPPPSHLVVAEGLIKRFRREGAELEVLRGIDLQIDAGEMLSIVGPSGAGKSTLLHLLGTLDLPTAGRIRFRDKELTELSSTELAEFRNRHIGFVFQFHHLLPEFDALENVMMPGLVRGHRRTPLRRKAQELLEEVGLQDRMRHRPGELSGGEQQRVALARALVMEPALVLADEPTGNLDTGTSEAVHRLLFELNQRRGTTFVIVTHSRELAALMPRVVTMRDGEIASDTRKTEDAPDADEAPSPANDASGPTDDPPLSADDVPARTGERDLETNEPTAGSTPARSEDSADDSEQAEALPPSEAASGG